MSEWQDRVSRDRPWSEYPIGTKAWGLNGGHWLRTQRGWKWHLGDTFPTPAADSFDVTLPEVSHNPEKEE